MSTTDIQIREAFVQSCKHCGIDTNTLTVEVQAKVLTVKGMVATGQLRHKLWGLLEKVDSRVTEIISEVRVMPTIGEPDHTQATTAMMSPKQPQQSDL